MEKRFGDFVKKMSDELKEQPMQNDEGFEQVPDEIANAIVGGVRTTNTSCNCTGGTTNTSCNCSSGGTNTSCNCSAV